MSTQNKQNWWLGICLGVVIVVVAGVLIARRSTSTQETPVLSVPQDQTLNLVNNNSSDVDDENLANLYALEEMVYRVTYHSDYSYEDENGQTVAIVRDIIHKVSVTPTLEVTFFEGMTSTDSEGETIDDTEKDTPNYTVYHEDGTTTNYAFGIEETGQWYRGESDDLYYGLDSEHAIAHTWTLRERPVKISDGVYQAADYEPGNSAYTFYFGTDHQLERVEWYNPDTNDTHTYVLLDEPVVREVPAEIVENAVPFAI